MESDIPPRVSNARTNASIVQRHLNRCSICKGEICDQLLGYLKTFPLEEIFMFIEELTPQEKVYFKERVLDVLQAGMFC
uniref:Saposin B-type domain-containing protein n=1 Tax=Panagrolaimus davidi TaxID=227884 RepID=A0A914Q4N4_9BILA